MSETSFAAGIEARRADDARRTLERERESAGTGIRIGGFVLAAIGLLVVHVAFGHEDYDVWARIFAALSGIIALAFASRVRRSTLPFAAYAALILYLSYGASTFSDADFHGALGPIPLERDSLTQSSFAALLVVVALVLAVPLGGLVGRRGAAVFARLCPGPVAPGFGTAAYVTAGIVASASVVLALRGGELPLALGYPAFVMSRPALAQGVLLVSAAHTGSPTPRRVAFGLTLLMSAGGLASGSLTPAVVPWISLAALDWSLGGRIPWRAGVLVVAFVIVVNPAKAVFRAVAWNPVGSTELTILDRATIWQEAIVHTWTGNAQDNEANLESTTDRIGLLAYGAQGIEWVPSVVPESGFGRWLEIPAVFIPRFLWPEKVNVTLANNVAYTLAFGLQTTVSAQGTTIAFPIIVDGYWTAGYVGVAIAGGVLGLLYGLFTGLLLPRRWPTLVIGVTMLTSIAPAMHLAGSVAGVPQMLLGALAVTWGTSLLSRMLGPPALAHP